MKVSTLRFHDFRLSDGDVNGEVANAYKYGPVRVQVWRSDGRHFVYVDLKDGPVSWEQVHDKGGRWAIWKSWENITDLLTLQCVVIEAIRVAKDLATREGILAEAAA